MQGRWIVVSLLVIDGLIGCTTPQVPPIRFAPYGSGYASKPAFDDVEYRFPLSPADRLQITPETLADLDQEQLDQVYARLTAGAMPDGEFEGKVLVPRGTAGDERLARLAGPFGATALELKGLALTEKAMRDDEDDAGERALERLRSLRDQLSELARTRAAGHRIVRRAAGWRSQRSPLVREAENAGHLDLLGGSCLVLARTSLSADSEVRHTMAPQVHELAGALSDLAENPGDLETRQGVADRALAVGRQCSAQTAEAQPGLAAVVTMVDLAATDIMVFAGVDPEQAAAAVEGDTGTFAVASPPATARVPFRRDS